RAPGASHIQRQRYGGGGHEDHAHISRPGLRIAILRRDAQRIILVGAEPLRVPAQAREYSPTAVRETPALQRKRGGRNRTRVWNDRLAPTRIVGLSDARHPECRAAAMQEQIE